MRSSKVLILVTAFVLMMLFSSIVNPQENSRTSGFTLKARIIKQTDNDSKVEYFPVTSQSIDFGYYKLNGPQYPERVYRSIYEVPVPGDLPLGAVITNVELIYQNSGDYTQENFALYNIPIASFDNTWSALKKWEITESGSYMHDFGVCGSQQRTISTYDLVQIVNDALEAQKTKIYLGFRSYPESGPYNTLVNNFTSLTLKYTYEIQIKHVLKNSNEAGKIDVSTYNDDFFEVNSGYTLQVPVGTPVKIRAKEEQFNGTYNWVWNQDPNTLENTKSKWVNENGDQVSLSREFSYMANANELYKTFTAQLKRKFLVNRIDQTEFDGSSQTNDIARVVEGNSVNIPYSETLTKITGTYRFAGWTDGGSSLKTPNNNTTYTALYKMSQKSNKQTAFSNSSQRKFILVPKAYHPFGGDMHLVYESMGKIWYEKSGDGGTTWALQNGGKPLNIDYTFNSSGIPQGTGNYTTAKHPSLDYYQDKILIVWQEQSGSNYVVKLVVVTYGTPAQATCIPFTSCGLYSEDVYPEIAVKDNGFAVIAIRRNDSILKGLEVHYISLANAGYGMVSDQCAAKIAGTDQNTGLFTIATDRSITDKFHIAWEQNYTSITNAMMYSKFNFSWDPGDGLPGEGSYYLNPLKTVNVSASTGYIKCTYPTMVGANDGSCRLAFKGDLDERYAVSSCGPENLSWIPYLRKYSGEVFSPQISLGSQVYFVGWTELTSGVYKTIATDSKTLRTMETVEGSLGRDMQINCNGASNQQYSLGFNSESSTLPYFFTRSVALGSIDPNKKVQITSGRGIFLTKAESQMYFILGNVTSEGVPVDFIESQDTVRLDGDLKKVNSFMTTKPFSLKDNSKLSFAVIYGTKDSTTSKSNIKDGEFASFKVDLVDDATGRVLGSYLSEKMDKGNIFKLKEGVYKISSDGIGSKLVRLTVSVEENMKSQYTISDMIFGEGLPLSKSLKEHEMGLEGSMEIKEYSLSQNYPNPFNPTTIVSYQIPKPSKVTLKIYDILGKEVATLVNGFKEIGKYSVEFNASSLPSGIYIYEIRANDFVKSGKMMLLK